MVSESQFLLTGKEVIFVSYKISKYVICLKLIFRMFSLSFDDEYYNCHHFLLYFLISSDGIKSEVQYFHEVLVKKSITMNLF